MDSEKSLPGNELTPPSLSVDRLTQRDFVEACVASPSPSPTKKSGLNSSNADSDPLVPDVMKAHIPARHAQKVESLVKRLLKDATSTNSNEWAPLSDKKDIKAHTKVNGPSGAAFYVKGETFLPYSIPEIFSVYFDSSNRPKLDSQMATYTRMRWITRHAGLEYMQFKGQWPTTPRDSCNFTVSFTFNRFMYVD